MPGMGTRVGPSAIRPVTTGIVLALCVTLALTPPEGATGQSAPFGPASTSPSTSSLSWTHLIPAHHPPPITNPAGAYDPKDQSVVVYGMVPYAPKGIAETWIYRSATWTQLRLNSTPPPLVATEMTYDPSIGGIILFGGETFHNVARSYTWEFVNSSWTNLTSSLAIAPPPRVYQAQAFDGALQAVVVFGGVAGPSWTEFHDTWEFTPTGWTNVTSRVGTAPPPRIAAAMAYDPAETELVLFGGLPQSSHCTTHPCVDKYTWVLHQGKWHMLNISEPGGRAGEGMTWDATTSSVIMWGGEGAGGPPFLNGTWSFTNDTWTHLNLSGPPGSWTPVLAYDGVLRSVVMFGVYVSTNSGYYDQTWKLG
jgi:hypothetical protein